MAGKGDFLCGEQDIERDRYHGEDICCNDKNGGKSGKFLF
jgi:hypothetical protein